MKYSEGRGEDGALAHEEDPIDGEIAELSAHMLPDPGGRVAARLRLRFEAPAR